MSFEAEAGVMWSSFVSKKEEKEKKQEVVYRNNIIDDETKAESVWKSILKRKGLPSTTKYEYVDNPHKAYDESYCDMLYLTIEEKKKNPEAAKSWTGRSTFEWLPAPPPPAPPAKFLDYSTLDSSCFDQRKYPKKICRNFHGIIYPHGSVAAKRKYQLTVKMAHVRAAKLKEYEAEGLAYPGHVYAITEFP